MAEPTMATAHPQRPVIVHPTDFAPGDAAAMAHAVALALASKSILRLLQVRLDDASFYSPTQGLRLVRDLLVDWGALGPDAAYDRWEGELDLEVSSVSITARNARAGILGYLEDTFCNLVVLATYPNKALTRWLDASVHSRLLRKGRMMSLFLRDGQRGFIDPKTGALRLKQILMPIAGGVDSVPAIRRIQAMLALVDSGAEITLMHAGKRAPALADEDGVPIDMPILLRDGAVVESILAVASELDVDAIAMPTAGRHGLLDAVRGSASAQVVEDARWPLLAVPVG
jgi:nucleotide-binding universal stress UspA family protein